MITPAGGRAPAPNRTATGNLSLGNRRRGPPTKITKLAGQLRGPGHDPPAGGRAPGPRHTATGNRHSGTGPPRAPAMITSAGRASSGAPPSPATGCRPSSIRAPRAPGHDHLRRSGEGWGPTPHPPPAAAHRASGAPRAPAMIPPS
jgi:hypothetical protein